MGGRLDGANLAAGAARHDGKSRFHRDPFEIGIDLEVAEEFFDGGVSRIKRLQIGSRSQAYLRDWPGEFRRTVCSTGHGARHWIDDDVFRPGIILCAVGVFYPQHIASAFDQGVLKASAGAEKWPVASPGE